MQLSTKSLVLLIAGLFVSNGYAILLTDQNRFKREQGAYQAFQLVSQDGVAKITRRAVSPDEFGTIAITLSKEKTAALPLFALLNEYSPSLDWQLFLMAIREENRAALEKTRELASLAAKELAKNDGKDQAVGYFADLASSLTAQLGPGVSLEEDFLKAHQPFFAILGIMADPKIFRIDAGDANVDEKVATALAVFRAKFDRAYKRTIGYSCLTETGPLKSIYGGCLLTDNRIVYSASQSTIDPLVRDIWLNFDIADRRCASLRYGGYRDWRLPTEQELLQATKYSAEIGFDRYLYYWTTAVDHSSFQTKSTKKLESQVVSSKSKDVVVGYATETNTYPFDSHEYTSKKAVTSLETETIYDVDRVLHATFTFGVKNQTLIRPYDGKKFVISRHTLQAEKGHITSQRLKVTNKPGTVEDTAYSKYLGQSKGTSPTVMNRIINEQYLGKNPNVSVVPSQYISSAPPPDIEKGQIGLVCVRGPVAVGAEEKGETP